MQHGSIGGYGAAWPNDQSFRAALVYRLPVLVRHFLRAESCNDCFIDSTHNGSSANLAAASKIGRSSMVRPVEGVRRVVRCLLEMNSAAMDVQHVEPAGHGARENL